MLVSEFNGAGDFLLGSKLARHRPVFAIAGDDEHAEVVRSQNFGIPVFAGPDVPSRSLPRTDLACIRPPKTFGPWTRLVTSLKPRVLLLEGKQADKMAVSMAGDDYEVYSDEYTGAEMGLPQTGKKHFFVLIKKQAPRMSTYFPFPDPDPNPPVLGSILDKEDPSVETKKGVRTIGDDERPPGFPVHYHKNPFFVRQGRKLSPRECARLMGFPDSFVLPDNNLLSYKILGESTWPQGVAKILGELKSWIL